MVSVFSLKLQTRVRQKFAAPLVSFGDTSNFLTRALHYTVEVWTENARATAAADAHT
jgi:hypothetical protein